MLRPVLKQVGLQSLEKHLSMRFRPENVGNWCPSPQNDLFGVFSKIYPEMFPTSPGAQLQEITDSNFSTSKIYRELFPAFPWAQQWEITVLLGSKKC